MRERMRSYLDNFEADERGTETMQVIMLIAVAGVALVLVKLWGTWYFEYTRKAIEIFVEN